MWEEKLALYDKLVSKCRGFERKGKNMRYTSANGYMFSQLNKDGELGIRFSTDVQEEYIRQLNTGTYKSYGATMKGYVLMPEAMWKELDTLAAYMNESYEYVMSLKPK